MHTVVLIDDDYITLQKLEKIFPWEKYSFKVVLSTIDPEEALHMIVKLNPDVIFTDISMCNFSGFDIIEHARNRGLKSIFVIVSGYSRFDYAQKAVKLNVVDYMLKPVSACDGEDILKKLNKIFADQNTLTGTTLSKRFKISNPDFQNLINYVDNNYMEQLELAKVSQMFKLNISYCCQLFKKYFDCSFSSYVITLKMNKALEMLTQSDIKISDISDFLHYDYTHFCKTFKKHFGITPYMYRKTHGIEKEADSDE